jgi:hypothetical protein
MKFGHIFNHQHGVWTSVIAPCIFGHVADWLPGGLLRSTTLRASRRATHLNRPQIGAWLIVLLGTVMLLAPNIGSAGTGASGASGSTGKKGETGAQGSTGRKGATGTNEAQPCPRQLDDGANAPALGQPIELTPAPGSAQRNVNFGASRATKLIKGVTFTADKQLPDSLTGQQLSFDAFLSRVSDTLESTDFPDPTFSQPRITEDRKSIKFTICLNPASTTPPGKYAGSVTLSGPPGLSAASVALTVNAKKSLGFWLERGAVEALIVAFLLLVIKDAAAYKKANPTTSWWWDPWKHPLADPLWWTATFIALGAAFGTLYALYKGNPTWGSEGFSDVAVMISATFAAVGGHAIISTVSPS